MNCTVSIVLRPSFIGNLVLIVDLLRIAPLLSTYYNYRNCGMDVVAPPTGLKLLVSFSASALNRYSFQTSIMAHANHLEWIMEPRFNVTGSSAPNVALCESTTLLQDHLATPLCEPRSKRVSHPLAPEETTYSMRPMPLSVFLDLWIVTYPPSNPYSSLSCWLIVLCSPCIYLSLLLDWLRLSLLACHPTCQ